MSTTRRPGNPLLAVAYLRASTEDQKLGPEAQRAAIEAWATAQGITIVATFSDAVSGGANIENRPGLVAALAELRISKAGVLVVAKRDRLARDSFIAQTIERAAKGCGAIVAAADGVGNGSSASDAFMRSIIDATAAYERSLIRARTKAALAAKKARGERAGTVPYGYDADASGKLTKNEAEQGVRAIVAELRAAGLSLRAVVAMLEKRGLVSRSGKPLGLTQVARMECAA